MMVVEIFVTLVLVCMVYFEHAEIDGGLGF